MRVWATLLHYVRPMTTLLLPCRLVADRALSDRTDRAIDLVSGRDVLLKLDPIGAPADQRSWADAAARWFMTRRPREPILRDYGVVGEHARFEAIAGDELAALGYERSVHNIALRLRVESRRTRARLESKRVGRALRRRARDAWQRLGSPASNAGGSRAP